MAIYTLKDAGDSFIARLKQGGIPTTYGYRNPVFGRTQPKDSEMFAEIWITNPVYKMAENSEYPYQCDATVELYVCRFVNNSEEAGKWMTDCDTAVRAFTRNIPTRTDQEDLWWDGEELSCDTNSPLKRWDGSLEDSPGWLVCLMELPVHMRTIVEP